MHPGLRRRQLGLRFVEPVPVWPHVQLHSVGQLQLQLKPLVFALTLACACSDAKPRPPVVEERDAATEGGAPIIDAGADAACSLSHSFGSSSCNACVAQTCCVPLAACYADSSCKQLVDCLIACLETPDAGGCASVCQAQTPDEKNLWSDLERCIYFASPCNTECAVTH